MPTYIVLLNYTEQGVRSIKESPQRVQAARRAVEAAGGKMPHFYLTMGPYDGVTIVEAPSDEAFASALLGIARLGNVRTTTLGAFTEEEFARIAANIP